MWFKEYGHNVTGRNLHSEEGINVASKGMAEMVNGQKKTAQYVTLIS